MPDSRCTPCYPGERHDWKRLPKRERPWIAECRNCGLSLVEGEQEGSRE
jgi:hypothetical protein